MHRSTFLRLAISAIVLAGGAAPLLTVQAAPVYTVGASLLTQQHPFYVELASAMKAQAGKDGITLEVSVANQDLNKQISDVEDFITKKVNVIILSPVDSKGVRAALMKAKRAGIPVITVDVSAPGAVVAAHVATDNYAGGVLAGNLMAQQLQGKGEVGIIDYPTVQSVVDRVTGFKAALAKFPNMKIVAIQPGITRAEALTVAQNMLQANPNLAGIFGFGDDAALAAVAATKAAHATGRVKVVGFDGMPEARAAVDKDANFVGVIQQYPDKMGMVAIDTALQVAKGVKVPALIPIVPGVYVRK